MTIAFTKVRGPFGWMGNMSPHPVRAFGRDWATCEHLFHTMRLPQNLWWRAQFVPNPMEFKMLVNLQL